MVMSKKGKAGMGVYQSLPPRHARGCPKNILRSATWQLATCDIDVGKKLDILITIRDVLPCLCPKGKKA